ncbi:hypothetical protein WS73_10910 [Burkholderia savannae]|nr:hypothetical protein WS73_10910 [Burkholderia savannae]
MRNETESRNVGESFAYSFELVDSREPGGRRRAPGATGDGRAGARGRAGDGEMRREMSEASRKAMGERALSVAVRRGRSTGTGARRIDCRCEHRDRSGERAERRSCRAASVGVGGAASMRAMPDARRDRSAHANA